MVRARSLAQFKSRKLNLLAPSNNRLVNIKKGFMTHNNDALNKSKILKENGKKLNLIILRNPTY